MKKLQIPILIVLCSASLFAQETPNKELLTKKKELATSKKDYEQLEKRISGLEADIKSLTTPSSYWKFGSFSALALNQSSYSNWVAGGEDAFAFSILQDLSLNYVNSKSKISWNNTFNGRLAYQTFSSNLRKVNDVFNVYSKFSYSFLPKLSITADLALRTQFLETLDYSKTSKPVRSSFFAPAWLNVGVGAMWKPKDWLSIYVSPLTAQLTFVLNDAVDPMLYGVDVGKSVRGEIGWYSLIEANKAVTKFLTLGAKCLFFGNYLSDDVSNAVDVDIRFKADLRISKVLYATMFVNFRFDENSRVLQTEATSSTPAVYRSADWQIFQTYGFGLSYRFEKIL